MPPAITARRASDADSPLLAELNQQLIRDEGHRNSMTISQLEARVRDWQRAGCGAILFEEQGRTVAYAIYFERPDEIYLRQLFVCRDRRREGVGRRAVELLRSQFWTASKRLTVDVLVQNGTAIAFWHALGYKDYCLTLEILPSPPTVS